jgi:hypothetical protein
MDNKLEKEMITCLASLSAAARTASTRKFYKIVCVFYNVLDTLHITETNLPEQYLTQPRVMRMTSMSHVTAITPTTTNHFKHDIIRCVCCI